MVMPAYNKIRKGLEDVLKRVDTEQKVHGLKVRNEIDLLRDSADLIETHDPRSHLVERLRKLAREMEQ